MQHHLSIPTSMETKNIYMKSLFFLNFFPWNYLDRDIWAASFSSSKDAAAASETHSSRLRAVMETWNTDAVIIQGHVDTYTPLFVKLVSLLMWIDRLWAWCCCCSPEDILNHAYCNSNDCPFFLHTFGMYSVYVLGSGFCIKRAAPLISSGDFTALLSAAF